MKKIKTLFNRIYADGGGAIIGLEPEPLVDVSKATPTVKWDGSCCKIEDGRFYKRYDAKHGKTPPEGFEPCEPEPDPITGHWPGWIECEAHNPSDRWFFNALINTDSPLFDSTYEAVGPHFNGNPYGLTRDMLIPHGQTPAFGLHWPYDLDNIRDYLSRTEIEGIVFWEEGEPIAKIKRSDFGFPWR